MSKISPARIFCLLCCVLLGFGMPAEGAEPAGDFLAGLRERGYHDLALVYLERMQSSPLASEEFKKRLLYERGLTLIDASRNERNPQTREKLLDEAQTVLKQFIDTQSGHPLVIAARGQLGNLLVERANLKMAESQKGNRDLLLRDARQLYEQAHQTFSSTTAELRTQLEGMRGDLDPNKDAEKIELRERLRTEYLQTQVLAAAVLEQMADTVAPGSPQQQELLTKAAEAYKAFYEKYRHLVAGQYAWLYQARCYQKLGKLTEALGIYTQILEHPSTIRKLKTLALKHAMECWLHESQQQYAEAVTRATAWIDSATANEAVEEDWLELRLLLAKAHVGYAAKLEQTNPRDRQIRNSRDDAKKLAIFVARHPSSFQQEAQQLVGQLGGPELAKQEQEPKTFAEAKDAGKEALDAVQTASVLLETLPERIRQAQDEASKAELQGTLDETQKTLLASRDQAIQFYELALRLVDAETPLEDVNLTRYYLAFLYYQRDDLYHSAVLGEFVARRYPGSAIARSAAEIALAAYIRLYKEDKSGNQEFQVRRAKSLASYVVETWPSEPQAITALNTLIPFMIQDGEYEAARAQLEKIPADSAQRVDAELKLGQALWSEYLRGVRELREAQQQAPPEEEFDPAARKMQLEQQKQLARDLLLSAINRLPADASPSTTIAAGVLSMAQLHVDSGEPTEAIALLEHATYGPLTLADNKHASINSDQLMDATYRTALRAYITGLTSASDGSQLMKKADAIMQKLKGRAQERPDGQQQLVATYLSLAMELQDQMAQASPENRQALSVGFETFLRQVRQASTDLTVLNWVAQTFFSMGQEFDDQGPGLPATAKRYYEEAANAYLAILEQGKKEQDALTPQLASHIQLQLAHTYRALGEFGKALTAYEEILKQNPMLLNVQMEAARTYQLWADSAPQKQLYLLAIRGARKDAKTQRNVIWGWNQLSKVTARFAEYRDQFHEARYNLAVCQYRYALSQSSSEKEKHLNDAERSIVVTQQLYPDLGGKEWQRRYDSLLRTIQKDLGKTPTGLKAIEAQAGQTGR